jgi:hypothetical protein
VNELVELGSNTTFMVHSFSLIFQPKAVNGPVVTAGVINFLMFVIGTASHAAVTPKSWFV